MTAPEPAPDWTVRTEPLARKFRSGWCRGERHAPVCDGYYPPGVDTFRCLCACHGPVPDPVVGP